MSMVCYPFDSIITGYDEGNNPIYDRAANSQVMADWMKHYFSNGVFGNETTGNYGFDVTTALNGFNLNVSPGACNIEGRFAKEDSTTPIILDAPDSSYDRIDSIVLRLSLETDTRAIFIHKIKGDPSSNPQAKPITRDSTIYDLKIAEVIVRHGATTIAQADIKDTRIDPYVCGLVAVPLKTFNTDTLYQQLEAALVQMTATNQAAFQEWFEHIQDILDGDVAGHLQNEIDKKGAKPIWADMGTISSLPTSKAVRDVTTDMVCSKAEFGTPSAQKNDWTVNTDTAGIITVSGLISGTTTLKLLMVPQNSVTGS